MIVFVNFRTYACKGKIRALLNTRQIDQSCWIRILSKNIYRICVYICSLILFKSFIFTNTLSTCYYHISSFGLLARILAVEGAVL